MYYFIYAIRRAGKPHAEIDVRVVHGYRDDLELTRALVVSGAQVTELVFVSDVLLSTDTHADRRKTTDA